MSDREIFLYLPSNDFSNLDNSAASFRIRLPYTLSFKEPYEVALVELQYIKSWDNISQLGNTYVIGQVKNSPAQKIDIPPGNYDITTLVDVLNRSVNPSVRTKRDLPDSSVLEQMPLSDMLQQPTSDHINELIDLLDVAPIPKPLIAPPVTTSATVTKEIKAVVVVATTAPTTISSKTDSKTSAAAATTITTVTGPAPAKKPKLSQIPTTTTTVVATTTASTAVTSVLSQKPTTTTTTTATTVTPIVTALSAPLHVSNYHDEKKTEKPVVPDPPLHVSEFFDEKKTETPVVPGPPLHVSDFLDEKKTETPVVSRPPLHVSDYLDEKVSEIIQVPIVKDKSGGKTEKKVEPIPPPTQVEQVRGLVQPIPAPTNADQVEPMPSVEDIREPLSVDDFDEPLTVDAFNEPVLSDLKTPPKDTKIKASATSPVRQPDGEYPNVWDIEDFVPSPPIRPDKTITFDESNFIEGKQTDYLKEISGKVKFSFSEKVTVEITSPGVSVKLSPDLKYALGFDVDTLTKTSIAVRQPDIRFGTDAIYVYCSCAAMQIVGSSLHQLLRVVDVGAGNYGAIITKQYDHAHFIPMITNEIQEIKLELKGDNNSLIKFKFGKTVAKLCLRPQRRFF
jgi:hypothetical protein